MHRAGLETMLMNYYRHIDRTQIQFDFLTHRPERSDYDDEIEELGGKIYRAPRLYPQNYPAYFAYMKAFFAEHPEYTIVHSHIDSMSYLPLRAAKKAGVPVRIAHSHNTAIDKDFKYILKQYFRSRILSVSNVHFACGEEAGRFLFKDRPFEVIPNAIEPERFVFDETVRAAKRQELGVQDKWVIGHIGRLSYQKNHRFLMDMFANLLKAEPNAVLLLVGTGEKEQELREQVNALQLGESVRFLGNRNDPNELYQAMDVFVLPSRFEGIPVVGVEAQYAGLPCVFSDKVPHEVAFTRRCTFLPLNAGDDAWIQAVLACRTLQRETVDPTHTPYDIDTAHEQLEQQYYQLHRQINQ